MRDQATHDALTGSWNRRAFVEIIQREIERARRENSSFALLMLDLDHFKQINDTMGHQTGDRVLQEVTRRVQSVIRTYDSVGRYGGEEFLVLVPGYDCQLALDMGERIRLSISTKPFAVDPHPITLTISIGIACIASDPDVENLIHRADGALYRAKTEGRNCCKLG
jgi:diguanylate cyclase (GGDEF)-like protein